MILTDRIELLKQANSSLKRMGLDAIFVEANEYPDLNRNLYVVMVETIKRRLNRLEYIHFFKELDLVIIDEAHVRNFTPLFKEFNPNTVVLGFTATPYRQGRERPLSDEYEQIVSGVQINELINLGFLSKPKYYGIPIDLKGVRKIGGEYDANQVAEMYSENKLYSGVFKNYERLAKGKKTIIFSSNIKSSLEITQEFRNKGYNIKHIDHNVSESERSNIQKWFYSTPDAILSNVGLFTRGFDQPDIECVILYRATTSIALYLQMVGRGSRISDGKSEFTVLDFGNNIQTHGFWHEDRIWSLENDAQKEKKEGVAPIKNCPNCDAILPVSVKVCIYCGHELPKTEEELEEIELKELEYTNPKEMNFHQLERFAELKGYKKQWVWRRVKENDLEAYANWKGYNKGWIFYQINLRRNERK